MRAALAAYPDWWGGRAAPHARGPQGTHNSACGVPGLVAVAIAANGSVANVTDIQAGRLEAGLAQSDVAYWAMSGTGSFDNRAPAGDLRAIAYLYPEAVHLVVRKGSGIRSVADLRGKRVSLDEPGSGTLAAARLEAEPPPGKRAAVVAAAAGPATVAADPPRAARRGTPHRRMPAPDSRRRKSTRFSLSAAGRFRRSPSLPNASTSTSCRSAAGRRSSV